MSSKMLANLVVPGIFICLIANAVFCNGTHDDQLQIVTDPNKTPRFQIKTNVSTASQKLIQNTVLPRLKRIPKKPGCDDDFQILASGDGSFTTSGSVQTAYLYQYCHTYRGSTIDGIAVFQNSKLLANVAFSPKPQNADPEYAGGYAVYLTSLHDINENGTDELALTYNYSPLVDDVGYVDIIEFADNGINSLGSTEWYRAIGLGEATNAARITVKKGTTPVFYSEGFRLRNGSWLLIKPAAEFHLDAGGSTEFLRAD